MDEMVARVTFEYRTTGEVACVVERFRYNGQHRDGVFGIWAEAYACVARVFPMSEVRIQSFVTIEEI